MNRSIIPFKAVCAAALLATMSSLGFAQSDYPSRPIKIVVPLPPGPIADVVPRIIAEKLAARWTQPVIIENRPGAGGIIASQALTQSAPDGYTLILVASGHPLNQYFYPKLPYDTFKDFTAISEIAYDSGFGDLSYFNRRFRRLYGLTPRDVRGDGR